MNQEERTLFFCAKADFHRQKWRRFLLFTPCTVINITDRYEESGLEKALKDNPRPGQPTRIDDRVKSKIVAIACSDPPEGFDRWTLDFI